ncbi:hypothetical protein [Reyranella sp.]|uniref:hypothetical protein n=1 Tax=Reyranella sp. TaxID=1929291 RepID=UPI001228DCA7|nr:hypothetical protein [Reyranella sp.]TAJ90032.1 MAG: hypothetical protein EPO50_06715 [Reyranella sp.]
MSGRSILTAVALSLWFLISVAVVATVAYVGFIGVGVAGLIMWFIWTLVELDTDAAVGDELSPGFPARQVEAKASRSNEELAASFGERLLTMQSVRFFRKFGAGLAVVGIGGFLLFQV